MAIVVELREAIDESPDGLAVGVEDVRAIAMNMHARDFLGIAIAADMVPLIDHEHSLAALSHRARKHATKHSAADDHVVEVHSEAPILEGHRLANRQMRWGTRISQAANQVHAGRRAQ